MNPVGGDTPALSLLVRDRTGLPADLVAWKEHNPGEWWLHDGETPLLGARQLAGAEMTAAPLLIFPTPESWFEDGGDGVSIIDWGTDLGRLFECVDLDLSHLLIPIASELALRLRENFKAWQPRLLGVSI